MDSKTTKKRYLVLIQGGGEIPLPEQKTLPEEKTLQERINALVSSDTAMSRLMFDVLNKRTASKKKGKKNV